MSSPTFSELGTLDYIYNGFPLMRGSPNSSVVLGTMDYIYNGQAVLGMTDSASTTSTVTLSEYVTVLDTVTGFSPIGEEVAHVADTITTTIYLYLTEGVTILDTATGSEGSNDGDPEEFNGSVCCQVIKDESYNGTTVAQVIGYGDGNYSTHAVITTSNLAPVTNASSASNPLTPTYISNGVVVYSNPATLPASGLSNARCYVKFACENLVGTLSASEIIDWNLSFQGAGGNWTVNSFTDLPDYGTEIETLGYTGTITKKGFNYPTSPFVNGGIFGKRELNKSLAFLLFGNKFFTQNQPNQTMTPPGLFNYKTHESAAKFIAGKAGVEVTWSAMDVPMRDFQPQMSQTAMESLDSLAAEVGAVVRPTGLNKYTVAYPDKSFGLWEVPDCCLLTALSKECNLDLNTGYYSPGAYFVPQLNLYDAGTINGPEDNTSPSSNTTPDFQPKQIEKIFSTKSVITDSDPVMLIDLPNDFEDVFIHTVTATNGQGVYVTTDPSKWSLLQTGFAGRYINNIDVGGVLKPVVRLDSSLFSPTNSDVSADHWYLEIGITRRNLNGAFDKAAAEAAADAQDLQARTIMRYKFIPICTGTITSAFFGSIPTVGMTARATLNGKTVEGIIESVSFSSPGIISVSIVQWARFKFYQQIDSFDNTQFIGELGT